MKKIGKFILIVDFVAINLIAIYFVYIQFLGKNNVQVQRIASNNISDSVNYNSNTCPTACVDLINNSERISTTPTPIISTTPIPTIKINTPTKAKIKYTSYLPIPGSGNTLSTDWIDISGTDFYLSTSDYPGLTGVYFEANIKLQNGNGAAYVRIYDVTNGRGVDMSTLSTSSQSSSFVTNGPVSLWAGYNHYRIQLKTLTADSAIFENGRLKIISEN